MAHDFKKFPELTNNQMQFYYFESPHRQITEDFRAKVVKVHDGDTIRVEWPERDFIFTVRLADIAAPELREEGGREGRDWLAERILNEEIDITIDPKNRIDKWGRILGTVFHKGINMNDELVSAEIAVPFGGSIDEIPSFEALIAQ
jgi:endonuclease YncB( thermonuclease family)